MPIGLRCSLEPPLFFEKTFNHKNKSFLCQKQDYLDQESTYFLNRLTPKQCLSIPLQNNFMEVSACVDLFFRPISSAANRSKNIFQEWYSFIQYSFYQLRYLTQQIFSQNSSSLLKINEATSTEESLIEPLMPNQTVAIHKRQILFLNPLYLSVKMNHSVLHARFIQQPVNISSETAGRSLDLHSLIQLIQWALPYLQKLNNAHPQRNKTRTLYFFTAPLQNAMNDVLQSVENKTQYFY